jgi:Na+/H+ antiporter NhaD/arsenite permease-like protein
MLIPLLVRSQSPEVEEERTMRQTPEQIVRSRWWTVLQLVVGLLLVLAGVIIGSSGSWSVASGALAVGLLLTALAAARLRRPGGR